MNFLFKNCNKDKLQSAPVKATKNKFERSDQPNNNNNNKSNLLSSGSAGAGVQNVRALRPEERATELKIKSL